MKISIILGTRPEIIKMSPVIRECEKQNLNYFLLHTGQHYDYKLDKIFFDELELPAPKYNLEVGSGSHAEETGKMLIGIEKVLQKQGVDIVLVEGDTNTVLAGVLAAAKLGRKSGHVEAGLRSYDRNMPEEINRVVADHVSAFLFAPTEKSRENLIKEGIDANKIFITGNTVVDAVFQNLEIGKEKSRILDRLNLKSREFLLVTTHRQENVDDKKRLGQILKGLDLVHKEFGFVIIYLIHPRTEKKLEEFRLKIPEGVRLVKPVGYLDFLQLEANARLVLTDSGGLQEETCVLKVPCVTLRDNTERPETLEVGANILAGTNPEEVLECAKLMINNREKNWKNPFGDGEAGRRIIKILKERGRGKQ